MSVNFNELLNIPVDSVKKPPTKPAGTYFATIHSYKFDVSREKKTPFCRFGFTNLQPGPDILSESMVDEDGEPIDLSKWQPHFDFYLTKDAMYRLKDFIETFKNVSSAGRPFSQVIPELKGAPVALVVIQRPSDDGQSLYNNISELKAA